MKRFRKNIRGQFVIVAALLIALLTLSVALSIHQVNLHRQQLRYEPVEELVLGITTDLDRSLTHALSIATQQYYETGSKEKADSEGYNFISKWVRSIIASYPHLGIKMNINKTKVGLTDVYFDYNWGGEVGYSYGYAKFDLDIDAYGFKGWVGHSGKFVLLKIFPESITPADQSTTFNFRILQGKDQPIPIPNLTPESLKIRVNITRTSPPIPAIITNLSYLGGGNYKVTFSPRININYTFGVELTVVTPEDSIYVSTYFNKDVNVFVTLQSQEENSPVLTNLGLIQLGDIIYTLPNSSSPEPGFSYFLRYTPENVSYTFLNWTTTGDVQVADPYSVVTSVKIEGNGTITAFYSRYTPPKPAIVNLNLDSREEGELTRHLGNITLGLTKYTLPANVTDLPTGDYWLEYEPHNSSYFFVRWEWSGDVIPWSQGDNSTMLTVYGNGTVIAVYGIQPPIIKQVSVFLQSLEETLVPPGNLGKIQLGATLFGLPNSTTLLNGTYFLKYIPAEGYTFLNWTITGDIIVQDPYSSTTSVTLNGNGTITAFYRGCKVSLNSKQWMDLSFNLGKITLGASTYALPKNLTGLASGDYTLQYTLHNSSYIFLWWEFSGDVIPWNSTSSNTTLTIYGDGTVTAVYNLISEPPPPFIGDWSTLYVDTGYRLMPPFMWSGKSSHLPSRYNTGTGKYWAVLDSPPTPTLYLARYVNVTAYVRPNPPWNAKDVSLELGFTYNGKYYLLGNRTFPVNSQGVYRFTIDILYGEFPEGYPGVIPEGSVILLTVTVTFFKQPWGDFKLFYGPNRPSCIELF